MSLNAAAVACGVPLVDAAQWGMTGTLIAVAPGRTACLRCLYPQDPQFEERFPVLGAISAAMGSLAALEAIKILAETGRPLWGRMWMIDGFGGRLSDVELARDPSCRCCGSPAQPSSSAERHGEGPTIHEDSRGHLGPELPCGALRARAICCCRKGPRWTMPWRPWPGISQRRSLAGELPGGGVGGPPGQPSQPSRRECSATATSCC